MLQASIDIGAHPGLTYYPEVGHFSWIADYSPNDGMDVSTEKREILSFLSINP